jgi:ribose transport system permease protein
MSPSDRGGADATVAAMSPAAVTDDPSSAWSVPSIVRSVFQYKEVTAAIILVALCVLLALGNEDFLTVRGLTLEARSMSFVGIASLGAMLVLSTGQLDLSVGSCMGLAGVLAAYCTVNLGLPDGAVLLVVVATGAFYGFVNGSLVVGLNLNSLIVTLATGLVGRGIVYALTNGIPVSGFSKGLRYLGAGFWLGLPVPAWILLGFSIVLSWIMARTTFGWRIYAIGGNEEAVRLSGVPVDLIKIIAFVVAGVMAAFGGMLLTARLGSWRSEHRHRLRARYHRGCGDRWPSLWRRQQRSHADWHPSRRGGHVGIAQHAFLPERPVCIPADRDWLCHPPGDGAGARAEYSSHMTRSPDPRFERLAPFSDLCLCSGSERAADPWDWPRQVRSTYKSSSSEFVCSVVI